MLRKSGCTIPEVTEVSISILLICFLKKVQPIFERLTFVQLILRICRFAIFVPSNSTASTSGGLSRRRGAAVGSGVFVRQGVGSWRRRVVNLTCTLSSIALRCPTALCLAEQGKQFKLALERLNP